MAGKSTLNRLEHRPRREAGKYHKIDYDAPSLEALFVDIFLDGHKRAPKEIVLDLDATDDTIHGEQEGRFFHGYYDSYCYLPLYIFCGRFLLGAKLRPANIDGAAGAVDEVARIVARIRARWPKVRIVLRGDSGFCREELMAWCEAEGVAYLFGLAPNARLKAVLAPEAWEAARLCRTTGKAARLFRDFAYQTETSWSRPRRVVGKAEHLPDGANPRFVVTSLGREKIDARGLYEDLYCARGEMENRIKECQLDLFADRTSSATMQANQLRLWFASMAYVLLSELRRIALRHTQFADATCGTIRLKLLKIGALVRRSVRRIKFAMASGFPWQTKFALAYLYLQRALLSCHCHLDDGPLHGAPVVARGFRAKIAEAEPARELLPRIVAFAAPAAGGIGAGGVPEPAHQAARFRELVAHPGRHDRIAARYRQPCQRIGQRPAGGRRLRRDLAAVSGAGDACQSLADRGAGHGVRGAARAAKLREEIVEGAVVALRFRRAQPMPRGKQVRLGSADRRRLPAQGGRRAPGRSVGRAGARHPDSA